MTNHHLPPPVLRSIDAAGGIRPLARALGIKHNSVYNWTRQVPAGRVLAIERLTGIPRHELRADLYPRD